MNKKLILISLLIWAVAGIEAAATAKGKRRLMAKKPENCFILDRVSSPLVRDFWKNKKTFNASLEENQAKRVAFFTQLAAEPADIQTATFLEATFADCIHVFKAAWCLKDVDLNIVGAENWTPLATAAHRGNVEMVKLLLAKKANCNAVTKRGRIPLLVALHAKQYESASMLIQAGADVNVCYEDGTSPLFLAALLGAKEMVEQLLKAGANVNKLVCKKYSPLYIALQNKHIEVAHALIGTEASEEDCQFLHASIALSASDFVRILLARGADCKKADKRNCLPLCHALDLNNTDIVCQLLDAASPTESDARYHDCYPLCAAVRNNSLEQFGLLLEHGARVRQGNHLYDEAIYNGFVEMLAELFARSIPGLEAVDLWGSILHSLALSKAENLQPILIMLQAEEIDYSALHTKDRDGFYPIHYACEREDVDVLLFLIEHGADINVLNDLGETPLYMAAQEGNLPAVMALVEKGAHKKIQNGLGLFPVEIARANGHKAIVSYLGNLPSRKKISKAASSVSASYSQDDFLPEADLEEQCDELIVASSYEPASVSYGGIDDIGFATTRKGKRSKAKIKNELQAVLQYEDSNHFVLRQKKEEMSVVFYKQARTMLPLIKGVRNMSGKQDKFHIFSSEIDKRLAFGIQINLQRCTEGDRDILDEYAIKIDETNDKKKLGFVVIMPGKIEGAHYDVRYAKLDKDKCTRGFVGAFVYLFDVNGSCYHRCFHENRESKQRHRPDRPVAEDDAQFCAFA